MKSVIEWLIDRIEIAVIIMFVVLIVTLASVTVSAVNASQEREKSEHQKMIGGYKSPVDRTDSDRLDWLDKHRDQTPWVRWGSDPRREIDYCIDYGVDTEAAK